MSIAPHNDCRNQRTTKDALRHILQKRRSDRSAEQYEVCSSQISDRLRQLTISGKWNVIHSFWPVPEEGEPDIRPFLRFVLASGRTLVLPKILSFSKLRTGNTRVTSIRLYAESDLRPNRWRIMEPAGTQEVPFEKLDAVIVPALGADLDGNRLGHGYGYYDEMLASLEKPRICPLFSDCLIDQVPTDSRDIPVNIIVTETRIYDLSET